MRKARRSRKAARKKAGLVYLGSKLARNSRVFKGPARRLNKGQPKPRLFGTSGHGYS